MAVALMSTGCAASVTRTPVPAALSERAQIPGLAHARFWGDEVPKDILAFAREHMPTVARMAAKAKQAKGRAVVEYLALSGGAGDGAYGAGLLVGWSERGTRPEFEVVTGVSAGALIAPFAFLGPAYDRRLTEIWTKYKTDDLATPQILAGLLGAEALADSKPLAELIAKYIDRRMLDRIAYEYRDKGRMLLVGTTNLDAQRPVIWNMGELAASSHPHAHDLFRQVLLASVSLPGVFPPVHIDLEAGRRVLEEMHVDGGPTRLGFPRARPTVLEDLRRALCDAPAAPHLHHQEWQADPRIRAGGGHNRGHQRALTLHAHQESEHRRYQSHLLHGPA